MQKKVFNLKKHSDWVDNYFKRKKIKYLREHPDKYPLSDPRNPSNPNHPNNSNEVNYTTIEWDDIDWGINSDGSRYIERATLLNGRELSDTEIEEFEEDYSIYIDEYLARV